MFINDIKKRFELFKNCSYSYFVLSGILATLGNGLIYITLSWQIYQNNNTVTSLTILLSCIWLPSILFGPFFGACADIYNRKYLLVISNLVRGICVVSFSLCYILSYHPNLYVLASLLGVFVSFYMPAALPLMQEIIDEDQIVNANATVDILYELGTGVGMGISGGLIVWFGSYVTMMIGGILFILASIFNIVMKYNKSLNEDRAQVSFSMLFGDYFFIFKYLKSQQRLIPIYLAQMLLLILLMTLPVLLLPFVQQILHAGSRAFALLEVVFSIGMIFGGIFSPTLSNKLGLKSAIGLLMILLAISLLLFANNYSEVSTFIGYFFVGFGLSAWALIISYGQMFTDNRVQGRLQASFFSISGIGILLLYVLLDFYDTFISISGMYLIESLIVILGFIFVCFISLPPHGTKKLAINE